MKKILFKISIATIAIYAIALFFISSNIEEEFRLYINSLNRLHPSIESKVSSFSANLIDAKAKITTDIKDSNIKNQVKDILKLPIETDLNLKYGPLIILPDKIAFGAVGFHKSMLISSLIKDEVKKDYKDIFPNDIAVNMNSVISFDKKAKESIDIDVKKIINYQDELEFKVTPIKVLRDYDIFTLKGINRLHTDNIYINDLKTKKPLAKIDDIDAKLKLNEIADSGLIYGRYTFSTKAIELILDNNTSLKVSFYNQALLKKIDNRYSNIYIENKISTLNKITKKAAFDINSTKTEIKLKNLGSKGLEELVEFQKQKIQNQKSMQLAILNNDTKALSIALANISKLDNKLVSIINHTLIKNRTQIEIKEEITTDKKSFIHLNATYMGEPIRGNIMSALLMVVANIDKLFNANLDMKMQKGLIKKLYPQASWILDSMVNKNMAKIEDGYYILKATLKDGKIIINNTKYAPQELIMLILI